MLIKFNQQLPHMQGRTIQQLLHLFDSMFSKQSLRKNIYLFNALTNKMELTVRVVALERRVAKITKEETVVLQALKECPLVEVLSAKILRIHMKGDQSIVRVYSETIDKMQVQELTKQIKCEIRKDNLGFEIEFQSQAAAKEFVRRVELDKGKYWNISIAEKDAYTCLKESINSLKKQRRHQVGQQWQKQREYPSYSGNTNYQQWYAAEYSYPIFIRRAVDSDDDERVESWYETQRENGQLLGQSKVQTVSEVANESANNVNQNGVHEQFSLSGQTNSSETNNGQPLSTKPSQQENIQPLDKPYHNPTNQFQESSTDTPSIVIQSISSSTISHN